ncbi:MAG: hypothetical protein NC092_06510 [Butyrivibrio sp.]|nr:hypothetical protein [Muribaculum sp.]MCM1552327.1 hypothetical protein [Butyrivibrio sp.]
MAWLTGGVVNLIRAIRITRRDKQMRDLRRKLDAILTSGQDEENDGQLETAEAEPIELSEEVHTIHDEYSDYEYVVNKAFKPAKSHAAEAELLSTYTPDNEYGNEADMPCIAVQIDDKVYCAVAEYMEDQTFDGAISIEPLEGRFLFRAKMDYFGDMMYFYGLQLEYELDGEEFADNAGLCLVYPRSYVGTADEEKLMRVLDEAAQSFKKK